MNSEKNEVIEIKDTDHRNNLINNNDIVVIDYYTDWCGPCKEIKDKYSDIASLFHDTSNCIIARENAENVDMSTLHEKIISVPTFHFYNKGKLIKSLTIKGTDIKKVENTITVLLEEN